MRHCSSLSTRLLGAFLLIAGTATGAQTDTQSTVAPDKPAAGVFSQGFSGGPDAEQDDPGLMTRGPKEAPLIDPTDLNGLWKPGVTPRKRPLQSLDDAFLLEDPPLRAGARKIVEQYSSIKASGKIPGLSTHACRSPGIYTTLFPAFVIAVVQTADNVFLMFEQPRLIRKIRLNASSPRRSPATYRGDSTGHWEGNTLVVETTGFNGLGELDISGAPISPKARMIERYTKSADGKSIQLRVTVDDPEQLSEPLVVERRWVLSGGVQQGEFDCEENPRQDMDEQTVYLEKFYTPSCIRIEGRGAEPSRVSCAGSASR